MLPSIAILSATVAGARQAAQAGLKWDYQRCYRPTVSLDIISVVASSCGYDKGQIEHRVAQ